MKFLGSSFTALLMLCATTNLAAIDLGNQVNLSSGYRNDQISLHGSVTTPGVLTADDRFRLENINLGQVGFNFRFVVGEADCCCDYPILRRFYLYGDAAWGWSGTDDFSRTLGTAMLTGEPLFSFVSHGRQTARTEDYQIGLGCLVYNDDFWAVGLSTGYAYDWERVKTKHGRTLESGSSSFSDDPFYNGLTFRERWQGPWIGADFFYQGCDWLLDIGYEYHFAHYHARLSLPTTASTAPLDTMNFSNDRGSTHAYGNVAFVNFHYNLCECWDLGLEFTYKHFGIRKGHLHPQDGTFGVNGFTDDSTGSSSASWISYSLLVDLGYSF